MKRHGYTVKVKPLVTGGWSWFAKRSYGAGALHGSGTALDKAEATERAARWVDGDLKGRAFRLLLNSSIRELLVEHPTRCRQLLSEYRSIAQAAR